LASQVEARQGWQACLAYPGAGQVGQRSLGELVPTEPVGFLETSATLGGRPEAWQPLVGAPEHTQGEQGAEASPCRVAFRLSVWSSLKTHGMIRTAGGAL
jgi:hypothetical protein